MSDQLNAMEFTEINVYRANGPDKIRAVLSRMFPGYHFYQKELVLLEYTIALQKSEMPL